jgi:hypothetical protein
MSTDHEWLNLIEVSGPFLAMPVLREVFPQGLEALTSGRPQRLRRTYDEWRDAVDVDDLDLPSLHAAWINEVLETALEMDSGVVRWASDVPERLTILMPEHGATLGPDMAVVNTTNGDEPLLLINVYEPDTDLDAIRRVAGLAITPSDRMVALLRGTGCPVGMVTNGERWMLVYAPVGAVAGFASWYARLWGQEPETLRAFVSLLGIRRFFGPEAEKLPALFERSLKYQDDVTEALGEQVRQAVEVLVQALDRVDQDRNRELLRDVDPRELYEAGLTVMMRLVFLLAAEERGLLLLGDPRYDAFYAISSLRMQLRADSEEILERRRSSWSRLLALFRGVFGGIEHSMLRLPALGGSLFDPDRFSFLEGRKKGTCWRTDPAEPLPIDDRTVLLLLEAIQTFDGRALSYRALDVEQIGHVYEGLLERTVKRVDDVTLELNGGGKAKSPRVTLGELESARLDGAAGVAELLKERSERSESAIRNALERTLDDRSAARLLTVCRGDVGLRDRILPYALLLRTDPWDYPLVHHSGAFVVVLGADRRESGTHYTPKSLTEKIVKETLTPVVYRGPAEGKTPNEWELKSVGELLDLKICDPAMGSGAFLVQVCRWLSDRLVEAWSNAESAGKNIDGEGQVLGEGDARGFEHLSQDPHERVILARRLIAERCLYGVDLNPLAVELAKLSLWLTTMSKGRPFGFLDHNLRSGDSLLGIHNLGQLVELDMNPKANAQLRLYGRTIRSAVDTALTLRTRLRDISIRDIKDVEAMAALDAQSRSELALPTLIADAFMGIVLAVERVGARTARIETLAALADASANGDISSKGRLSRDASKDLAKDSSGARARRPFNWPLEFPEVFDRANGGFDAIASNPPYLGGRKIGSSLGPSFLAFLVSTLFSGSSANADLCAFFVRRTLQLLRGFGSAGYVATSSISEGDTRTACLDVVINEGMTITKAYSKTVWPGRASVTISPIWIYKGKWNGPYILNDVSVLRIDSRLSDSSEDEYQPKRLSANIGLSFQGSIPLGKGFVLSRKEYLNIVGENARYEDVIWPYLVGKEINSDPLHAPSKYIINFQDWPIDKLDAHSGYSGPVAEDYPACLSIIKETVFPERTRLKPNGDFQLRKPLPQKWWIYGDKRPALYKRLMQLDWALAVATQATKYIAFALVRGRAVYSHSISVIATNDFFVAALISSSIHEVWARKYGSYNLMLIRYSPTDLFETFPFPVVYEPLREAGREYFETRTRIMVQRDEGLTEIYNRFHDSSETSEDILELRRLHVLLDKLVMEAYGFNNVDLSHDFYDVPYLPGDDKIRFTISEEARLDVLHRLAELNRNRHQEEINKIQHAASTKHRKGIGRRTRATAVSKLELDFGDFLPNAIEEGK